MKKVVFLDRDGTINKEIGYLHRREDFEFIPKAAAAIRRLNENDFMVAVVTNQAGVAKGIYKEKDVLQLHTYMQTELKKANARIDEFCYCPYHPDGIIEPYKKDSIFRKPGTGMLDRIDKMVGVDKENSWMIGDMLSDIQAGKNFGVRTILVSTGYGRKTFESGVCCYDYYVNDISEAVEVILSKPGKIIQRGMEIKNADKIETGNARI